jgi:trimeric autotransporter adhesin
VPVSVTSTNTSIGTITGSPASITAGSNYYTQAISFVPATAGVTNLNLAIPTGYFTPSNQSVQIAATVTAPAINIVNPNGQVGVTSIVGNNSVTGYGIRLAAAPPSNEMLTLTSSDPTHFLLSTSSTTVGSTSINLQLTGGSASVPAFYVEGQNFSGAGAITATLTASAAGYSDGTATLGLYPTGLTYLNSGTLNTTTFSSPTPLTVYFVVLNPGTLTYYTAGYPVGPQAPGSAVPVSVTSTNTNVGTITGSPASIAVGTYYTQAISFVPATAGTTNLNLAIPTGYFTPSNQPVQIAATVSAPVISLNVNFSNILGNNLLSNGNLSLGASPPSNETLTLTSSDPTHFLLSTSPTTVGSASITLQLTAGNPSVPAFYVEGQNFSGAAAITGTLTASAAGYSDGVATVSLYPTGLSYYPYGGNTLNTTTTSGPSALNVYLVTLTPGTLTWYGLFGYTLGPQAPAVSVSVTSSNTNVGTVTGSPASIPVGSYISSTLNFVPATAGTTNLNLDTASNYSTPSNLPIQIAVTVQ